MMELRQLNLKELYTIKKIGKNINANYIASNKSTFC